MLKFFSQNKWMALVLVAVAIYVFLLNYDITKKVEPLPVVTQIQYVFETTGNVKEVTFLTTSSDNPNNTEVQEDLNAYGSNSMLHSDIKTPELGFAAMMPDGVAVDVWCKVEPRSGQFSVLRVVCFQPGHNGHGIDVYGEYDPSVLGDGNRRTVGYYDLEEYVARLRTELRNLLVLMQNQ